MHAELSLASYSCSRRLLRLEAKLTSFWNLVLDEKKPLFATEKFLTQASEEGRKG